MHHDSGSHRFGTDPARIVLGDDEPKPEEHPAFLAVDVDDPALPQIIGVIRIMRVAGLDTQDPALIAHAVEAGRARHANPPPPPQPQRAPTIPAGYFPQPPPGFKPSPSRNQCVYYMRIGDRCKIGYTSNLLARVKALNPEELMAAEPGTEELETRRHREFHALRTHGEWFRLEEPLVGHVARLAEAASEDVRMVREFMARARRRRPKGSSARRLA